MTGSVQRQVPYGPVLGGLGVCGRECQLTYRDDIFMIVALPMNAVVTSSETEMRDLNSKHEASICTHTAWVHLV